MLVLGEITGIHLTSHEMDVDTRSDATQHTNSAILRKKSSLRTRVGNLTGLIKLGRRLKTIQREAFERKYGNLLSLMEVKVQLPAITALAQYYDSPLRCFTFQDFQLAPTIEEFEQQMTVNNSFRSLEF